MKRSSMMGSVLVTCCGLLASCTSEKTVDLGNSKKTAALGAQLSDYAGDWSGYAEAYKFSDDTDVMHLSLDAQGNGVLEVGKAAKLPPPDADHGYPPGYETGQPTPPKVTGLVSGFSYPVAHATVASRRMQLGTKTSEIYRQWCSLLPPVKDELNSTPSKPVYSCVPNGGWSSSNGQCTVAMRPTDCGKIACFFACTCDANSCKVQDSGSDDVQLDAALDMQGEELAGTLVIDSTRINVRMTRN